MTRSFAAIDEASHLFKKVLQLISRLNRLLQNALCAQAEPCSRLSALETT